MVTKEDTKYILLEHEKRFLEIYSEVFQLRRSTNFGIIFALLCLKARTKETALDQQDIVNFINHNFKNTNNSKKDKISLSTVSRALNQMETDNYCLSTPSKIIQGKGKTSGRGRRLYYTDSNFERLVIERLNANVKMGLKLITILTDLRNDAPSTKEFDEFREIIDNFKRVYEVTTKYYDEILAKIIKDLE